jgi:hypothetical protein
MLNKNFRMSALQLFSVFIITFSITVAQEKSDIDVLASWMTGSFSSSEQAATDSHYFDIRLEMVRIWPWLTDGYWLYIEQAAAETKDKPYRQRVYHLINEGNEIIKSVVYELPDPMKYAGEYKLLNPLSSLKPAELVSREECSVYLKRMSEEVFEGSTLEKNCKSSLRGAVYATSEVRIMQDKLISWDRGFNDKGEQVWGATKGGYVFKKLE